MATVDDTTYFLTSERLGFRTWRDEDIDLAFGLWGDIEVTRLFGGPFSEESIRSRFERELSALETYGIQYWPLFLLDGGDHIGCCGLRPYKPDEGIAEMGFHFRPPFWGKGYGSEGAKLVIQYAREHLGMRELVAGHHPSNERSRNLLAKLGFTYVDHQFYEPTGLMHPNYRLDLQR